MGDLAKDYSENPSDEIEQFASFDSFEDVLQHAALATDSEGNKHRHQWRIPRRTLSLGYRALRRAGRSLRSSPSFQQLHERIRRTVKPIKGLGALYFYDVATRVGAYLDLYPESVYLHAGTRDGAKALGLDHRQESIALDQLPAVLRQLSPHQIEDFLCIFEAELRNLERQEAARTQRR